MGRASMNTLCVFTEDIHMEQNNVIFTQIVFRPARKLILRRSKNANHYFAYLEEVGRSVAA